MSLDDYPERIEVEFEASDVSGHLAAHEDDPEYHASAIAQLDQHRAAEGNPSTVTLPTSLADLLCRDE